MTFTTTPNALTDGIEKLLHPLNKLHVPVHEVAMMMSIALRFIPILLEETDKIMKAQIARARIWRAAISFSGRKRWCRSSYRFLCLLSAVQNDLAMAMEARCYNGGEGRTKMKPLVYRKQDRAAYGITILYMVVIVLVGRFVPFQIWIF